ncbi:MAG: hypothetical protein ABF633_02970 [Clostridium sp.]|uniref:hypothetical protein n=1 Tax=Clostridium sp. TaxID=1506 RepID=UPI0039E81B69
MEDCIYSYCHICPYDSNDIGCTADFCPCYHCGHECDESNYEDGPIADFYTREVN